MFDLFRISILTVLVLYVTVVLFLKYKEKQRKKRHARMMGFWQELARMKDEEANATVGQMIDSHREPLE